MTVLSFSLKEVNCQILAGKFYYVVRIEMALLGVHFRKAPSTAVGFSGFSKKS